MLLLCTANQCRSPMAEALLRRHLERAGVTATVTSAGVYEGGAPAMPDGVAVMASRGLDITPHRSRRLAAEMVDDADLVIAMAREHAREAAVLVRGALSKTFTLKELARGAETAGPRDPGEPLDEWLAKIAATRSDRDLLGVGYDDELDVADPIGRGRDDYEATAGLLDRLLGRIVTLAFPRGARQQEQSA